MAIKYGFFNSVGGDRKYTAADIGKYLQGIVSSGVYADSSTSLQVLAAGGMEVQVQVGRAMLDYHYMENDAVLGFTLAPGDTQDRIDAIVARLDMTNRLCEIAVKEGTPAAAPKRPAVERTDTIKEYMLASVYVARLATAITQANITDTRPDTTVCGWVTGVVKQVDTSTLYAQWQAAYEEAYAELGDYLAAQEAAWEAFFASVTEDNVLPAPSLGDAGKMVAVNDDATGYKLVDGANITTDDTLTIPGAAADAAETGSRIKRATVHNILDNSYFRDRSQIVNQRGFAGGAPSADNVYVIDRWKTQQNAAKNIEINFSDSGLIIHVSTGLAGIAQRIPTPKTDVTFAAKVNGKIVSVHTEPGEDASVKTDDNVLLYVEWLDDVLQVIIRNTGEEANTYTVEWAALYEGEYTAETLPPYVPKGYSAELMECQRYFRRLNIRAAGVMPTTTTGYINLDELSNMRINPTVVFENYNGTIAFAKSAARDAAGQIKSVSLASTVLTFTFNSAVGTQWEIFYVVFPTPVSFSADL